MSSEIASRNDVQGEGNYDATEDYSRSVRDFVKRGKIQKAARDAAPKDAREQRELERAEKEGLAHAQEAESQAGQWRKSVE